MRNHPYDGGNKNGKHGLERVIYYHEEGEVDPVSQQPKAYFCAVVTHYMAASGRFKKCFVPV